MHLARAFASLDLLRQLLALVDRLQHEVDLEYDARALAYSALASICDTVSRYHVPLFLSFHLPGSI